MVCFVLNILLKKYCEIVAYMYVSNIYGVPFVWRWLRIASAIQLSCVSMVVAPLQET